MALGKSVFVFGLLLICVGVGSTYQLRPGHLEDELRSVYRCIPRCVSAPTPDCINDCPRRGPSCFEDCDYWTKICFRRCTGISPGYCHMPPLFSLTTFMEPSSV